MLRRPDVRWADLAAALDLPTLSEEVAEQVEIDAKYSGYVQQAQRRAERARGLEHVTIPAETDWAGMHALSWEVRERLVRYAPTTLGQLSRLPGVTPAAVNVVAAWLSRRDRLIPGSTHPG